MTNIPQAVEDAIQKFREGSIEVGSCGGEENYAFMAKMDVNLRALIGEIVAERDAVKAQRDDLVAKAKECRDWLAVYESEDANHIIDGLTNAIAAEQGGSK